MQEQKSIYSIGANDGLVMGLYLSMMFLLQAFGMRVQILLILGNLMMLGIPVIAYILLRNAYRQSYYRNTFSAIWLHGIIAFLCGSLIMALVAYVYLRVLNPSFIVDQVRILIGVYNDMHTPEAEHFASMLERIIDKHLLPTPIAFAFSLLWLISFMGSMLSMLIALVLKWLYGKRNRTYPKIK